MMLKGRSLIFICFLLVLSFQDCLSRNPPPNQLDQPKPRNEAVDSQRLVLRVECRNDIQKFCAKDIAQAQGNMISDLTALLCLQDAVFRLDTDLQPACSQLVWDYKMSLTQDLKFIEALNRYCTKEIAANNDLKQCTLEKRAGYALSCFMDYVRIIPQNSDCYKLLADTERLAFSDFRLIAPFVEHCSEAITALNCGSLLKPSVYQTIRHPHTQGETLECLNKKLSSDISKLSQTEQNYIKNFPDKCRFQVSRLTDLQFDDFHLDRPLFFACREDRERFCGSIQAGDKKVLNCLFDHKDEKEMNPKCSEILSNHLALLGRDYRLAHSLINECHNEMATYRCVPQVGFEKSLQFYLSWVLVCLESNYKAYALIDEDKKKNSNISFTKNCQKEMISYRKLFLSDFHMAPELVLSCPNEINLFCSKDGDLFSNTIHCLMAHAKERVDRRKMLSDQCRNALENVIRVADIGSNYRVDKVLYASCRPLIDGKCQMDAVSEASTLRCLMENVDGPDMTDECEQRLMEVHYFMARDWTLDPELYSACHDDAVKRCSAIDNWHMRKIMSKDQETHIDPGPQVLACLYRAGYDEENPLSGKCQLSVRRVLRNRASRVNLLPSIEENCRDALSDFCSNNTKPSEEMGCLQMNFETAYFKNRYPQCYKEIVSFTNLEAKDTRLNKLLTRACHPVIQTYCEEFEEKEIDHGGIMDCLINHKNKKEMTKECKSYVNHYQLITLRDYHFSYNFNRFCQGDIKRYCSSFGDDKGEIIRCLSEIVFEHQVLGNEKKLKKECKEQLKLAYLQQEQVNFDDKAHFKDVDSHLTKVCDADIKRLNCFDKENFENVVECLRIDFDTLDPNCKSLVFNREKIEAVDNTFDDELQKSCTYDINKFCNSQKSEKVLDCLTRTVRLLQKNCQKVVQERMFERTRDDRLNPGLLEACKTDAKQYCPEDYRKINDPRYAKQQLGGIIASCLRSKFAQFNNGIYLSPQCKDEVSKVILESEFDIKLDPALYKSCGAVINRHCSSTILQRGGNFDNVLECLKADFYTGQISDPDCARQLARRTQESLVDIHLDPSLHEACSLDIQRVCKDTPPGQSRIIMCLMEAMQAHQIIISSTCRTKLTERQRLWNIAHDKYKMLLPHNWNDLYNAISTHPERSSILTYLGIILVALLLVGCIFGRWSKRTYSELKNR